MKIFRPFVAFTLVCFALSQRAQGVVPPPDGGYPNFTTAEGQNALQDLTTGAANTALGAFSLFSTTTGSYNTAVGAGALDLNTGNSNTAVGVATLLLNTGDENTAVGLDTLGLNTAGNFNAAVGAFALSNNTTGQSNTAIGHNALESSTTGGFNTAIGHNAGVLQTTGSSNVYIGDNMQGVAGESNACYIASIFGQTSANGIPVLINSNNKLGTLTSSKRFKEQIKPMDKASDALLALKPVSFRYKKEIDPAGTPQFGLVAEDVEKINPDLVVRDKQGKPYSVRYDAVNAMLLNEFLKARCKVEQQQATITQLQQDSAEQRKQIEELSAGLQKVSAQLELNKSAPQTVLNNH